MYNVLTNDDYKDSIKFEVVFGPETFERAIELIPRRMTLISPAKFHNENLFLVKDLGVVNPQKINAIYDIFDKQTSDSTHPERNVTAYLHFYFKGMAYDKVIDLLFSKRVYYPIVIESKTCSEESTHSAIMNVERNLEYDFCVMFKRNFGMKEFKELLELML